MLPRVHLQVGLLSLVCVSVCLSACVCVCVCLCMCVYHTYKYNCGYVLLSSPPERHSSFKLHQKNEEGLDSSQLHHPLVPFVPYPVGYPSPPGSHNSPSRDALPLVRASRGSLGSPWVSHELSQASCSSLGSLWRTAAAAKSLQSCPTPCNPTDGSPPGSPIPGILQVKTLEWVAISFSNA